MREKKGKNVVAARNQQVALTLPYQGFGGLLEPQGRGHAGVVAIKVAKGRDRPVIVHP
jgi:hypothetical protein